MGIVVLWFQTIRTAQTQSRLFLTEKLFKGGGVMERPERYPSGHFIPELIEDEDIIFNKDSEYHKQKKKEKKNPIFKRNKSKNRWAL